MGMQTSSPQFSPVTFQPHKGQQNQAGNLFSALYDCESVKSNLSIEGSYIKRQVPGV